MPDAIALGIGVASLIALAGWLAWQYRAASMLVARGLPPKHTPPMGGPVVARPGRRSVDAGGHDRRALARCPPGREPGGERVARLGLVAGLRCGLGHPVAGCRPTAGGARRCVPGHDLSPFTPQDVVDLVRVGSIAGVGAAILVGAAPLALFVMWRVTAGLSPTRPLVAPARPDV